MRVDYVATGLFFMGISISIFRWVLRTAAEADGGPPPITRLEEEVLRQAAARSGNRMRENKLSY